MSRMQHETDEVQMKIKNLPNKSGFYLARSMGFDWWNMVVDISGDAPFLKVKVYDRASDSMYKSLTLADVYEFGPEIDTSAHVSLDNGER